MKNRVTPLFLTAAILLLGLASCSESGTGETGSQADTQNTQNTEAVVTDDKLICDPGLPAADFGG